MTPKEKAKELVDKYMPHIAGADRYNTTLGIWDKSISKNCALIAVDEILKLGLHEVGDYKDAQTSTDDFSSATWYISYWVEVKQEIEKL